MSQQVLKEARQLLEDGKAAEAVAQFEAFASEEMQEAEIYDQWWFGIQQMEERDEVVDNFRTAIEIFLSHLSPGSIWDQNAKHSTL